jgi:hypothetical protein
VTLGRLLQAWLFVAVWFALAGMLPQLRSADGGWRWAATAGEASIVTLLGSLWFDSLGHGGWWLVFLLVGVLAAYSGVLQVIRQGAPPRRAVLLGLLDTARYVVAGGILAWRLA